MSRMNIGRVHLPVAVEAAEVVAGVGADHQLAVGAAADDVERLAERQDDRVVPLHPALRAAPTHFVEPVRVLVAGLDLLDLAAGEPLVEQRRERLGLERLARERAAARPGPPPTPARNSAADSSGVTLPGSAARSGGRVGVSTPKLKSSGRSQKPRNSAAQRGESFIDSS